MTTADRELHDAREQLAASREILAALGRDVSNPGAVLDTVLEYAARLCGAAAAQLFIRDDDVFRLSRVSGETPEEYRRYLMAHPIARNRLSTVGRAAEDKCTVQIADVLADADYGRLDLQQLTGFRTLLSTPMILQDEVVGVLSMWRTDVAPFDDRERQLLEEFAVQAAIVLRQVNLMRALESRGAELSDKVEQLEALREVDEAVGSSLDLDEVLERIVTNAVRLTNLGFGDITLSTEGGSILEYDEATDSFHVRGKYGSSPALWERLRDITIDRKSSLIGQTALADQPLEIPDLAAAERDEFLETLFQDSWRSLLAVPMIAGDEMIGVLVIRRRGTGDFPSDVVELLETFASQSALAIVNARLFRELETQSKRARDREQPQVGVPCQHVPRTADTAQRGDRLLGSVAGAHVRGDQPASGGIPARHLELRSPPAGAAQRDPGPVQGRSGPNGARPNQIRGRERPRIHAGDGPRARGGARHQDLRRHRRRRRGDRGRRAAFQAGRPQPAVQRGQVHTRRRQRVRRAPAERTPSSWSR